MRVQPARVRIRRFSPDQAALDVVGVRRAGAVLGPPTAVAAVRRRNANATFLPEAGGLGSGAAAVKSCQGYDR